MKKVAYLRVSTEDQNLNSQKLQIEKYLKAHNITVEFYEEKASGGSIKKRPVYNRLMREVKRKEISHIYVFKLDRFSRNTKDFLIAHDEMERNKTKFISISDSLDFSTPVGRMFAQLLSIFAEFERNQIVSRTKAGLEAAKARGQVLGKKKRPIDINEIIKRKNKGEAIKEIAKSFNLSKSQLYRRISMQAAR